MMLVHDHGYCNKNGNFNNKSILGEHASTPEPNEQSEQSLELDLMSTHTILMITIDNRMRSGELYRLLHPKVLFFYFFNFSVLMIINNINSSHF